MDAAIEIMNLPAGTYNVGTDDARSLQEFVEQAFGVLKMDWQNYVQFGHVSVQPIDLPLLTTKTHQSVAWRPTRTFEELVEWLVRADLDLLLWTKWGRMSPPPFRAGRNSSWTAAFRRSWIRRGSGSST